MGLLFTCVNVLYSEKPDGREGDVWAHHVMYTNEGPMGVDWLTRSALSGGHVVGVETVSYALLSKALCTAGSIARAQAVEAGSRWMAFTWP